MPKDEVDPPPSLPMDVGLGTLLRGIGGFASDSNMVLNQTPSEMAPPAAVTAHRAPDKQGVIPQTSSTETLCCRRRLNKKKGEACLNMFLHGKLLIKTSD